MNIEDIIHSLLYGNSFRVAIVNEEDIIHSLLYSDSFRVVEVNTEDIIHSLLFGDSFRVAVVDEEDIVQQLPFCFILIRLNDAGDTGPVPDLVMGELSQQQVACNISTGQDLANTIQL